MYQTSADKILGCADCGQDFTFTGAEQAFYAEKGFTEPRRCPSCRASRKAARGDGGGYEARPAGPREMFSATCSSCGREAQVPFQPTGSKPVYCSDCFRQRRAY